MKSILAMACMALMFSALVQAQGVYVTPGANGPVFSDKPQSGAKSVTLPPLNVVAPPSNTATEPAVSAAGQNQLAKQQPIIPEYRSFAVISPQDGGSVAANNAVFEVRLAIDPPLQLGEGHAFLVNINGRPVGLRYTAMEFMIPPEFWGDTLPPANQAMQLDAYVVDLNGQVLKRAAPVRFFMRYVQFYQHQRPPLRPMPPAKTTPGKPPYDPRSVGESKNFTLDMP